MQLCAISKSLLFGLVGRSCMGSLKACALFIGGEQQNKQSCPCCPTEHASPTKMTHLLLMFKSEPGLS